MDGEDKRAEVIRFIGSIILDIIYGEQIKEAQNVAIAMHTGSVSQDKIYDIYKQSLAKLIVEIGKEHTDAITKTQSQIFRTMKDKLTGYTVKNISDYFTVIRETFIPEVFQESATVSQIRGAGHYIVRKTLTGIAEKCMKDPIWFAKGFQRIKTQTYNEHTEIAIRFAYSLVSSIRDELHIKLTSDDTVHKLNKSAEASTKIDTLQQEHTAMKAKLTKMVKNIITLEKALRHEKKISQCNRKRIVRL